MNQATEKSNKQTSKKTVAQEAEVSILSSAEASPRLRESEAGKAKTTKPSPKDADPVLVRASLRYLRMSAKKVRLITSAIKGLPVNEALNRLPLINKLAVREVTKLLRSAMANAEHNFKLNKADLYIRSAVANDGPTLHRWLPAAFGSAHPIKKRSCHIELVLAVKEDKSAGAKKTASVKKSAVKKETAGKTVKNGKQ